MLRSGFAVLLCLFTVAAFAHVTVWPRESAAGTYEKYVVRVPTEGKIDTQSVELRVPDGVEIVSVATPVGYRYEVRRVGPRITAIVWSAIIKPGEFMEFAFMARNPKALGELRWEAVQRFIDGSTTEWNGRTKDDKHPASVTRLIEAADAAHGH